VLHLSVTYLLTYFITHEEWLMSMLDTFETWRDQSVRTNLYSAMRRKRIGGDGWWS